jgi:ankyrin repeat protein
MSNTFPDILNELMELVRDKNSEKFLKRLKEYKKRHPFNIDSKNEYGNTLLHIACRCRNFVVVKTLIEDYNAKISIVNEDGRTPLHIATIYGSTNKTSYLTQDGSTKAGIVSSNEIINMMAKKSPYLLMIKDKDGKTAMDYFSMHSELDSNPVLNNLYKRYKRSVKFFDSFEKYGVDKKDRALTMDIYFAMKECQ